MVTLEERAKEEITETIALQKKPRKRRAAAPLPWSKNDAKSSKFAFKSTLAANAATAPVSRKYDNICTHNNQF